jgi:hypothetical protein
MVMTVTRSMVSTRLSEGTSDECAKKAMRVLKDETTYGAEIEVVVLVSGY